MEGAQVINSHISRLMADAHIADRHREALINRRWPAESARQRKRKVSR
jgi:hypothetical protein